MDGVGQMFVQVRRRRATEVAVLQQSAAGGRSGLRRVFRGVRAVQPETVRGRQQKGVVVDAVGAGRQRHAQEVQVLVSVSAGPVGRNKHHAGQRGEQVVSGRLLSQAR